MKQKFITAVIVTPGVILGWAAAALAGSNWE